MRMRRAGGRDEGGAATTELVLATPALLFLIMLLIQTGLWYHAQHVAQAAAQEGVRVARVEMGTAGEGEARANQFLDEAGRTILENRSVSAQRSPDRASVTVTGTGVNLVPGLHFRVDETADSPVERFRPV